MRMKVENSFALNSFPGKNFSKKLCAVENIHAHQNKSHK